MPSSSSNDKNEPSSQCQKCVEMLAKVLMSSKSESRALELLRAMGGKRENMQESLTVHPNGVTVDLSKQSTTAESIKPVRNSSSTRKEVRSNFGVNTRTELATSSIATPSQDSLKIECRPCGNVGPEGGARAYVMGPDPLSVVLCGNRLSTEQEMDQVLVHELIHVYDVFHLKLDLRICNSLAYSEIRAAREAECFVPTWFMPQQSCVKNKATTATRNLFPHEGRQCIQNVFDKAMSDTRPFKTNNKNASQR